MVKVAVSYNYVITLAYCRNAEDAGKMVKLAAEVNSRFKMVESVDEKLISDLSWTAAGLFPPLATAIGGLVAQETLISLTGKFSPLRQWVREGGGIMYCIFNL